MAANVGADIGSNAGFGCHLRHRAREFETLASLPEGLREFLARNKIGIAERGEYFNQTDAELSGVPNLRFLRGASVDGRWLLLLINVRDPMVLVIEENKSARVFRVEGARDLEGGNVCAVIDGVTDGKVALKKW